MKPSTTTVQKYIKRYVLILKDCKPAKQVFTRLGAVLVFYFFCLHLMSVTVVLAGMRYPRQAEELPDLGFVVLPALDWEELPNHILLVCLLSSILRFIFHRKGLTIIRRFMTIHGIAAVLRSTTLVATSYPDPSFACAGYKPADTPKVFWKNAFVNNLSYTCGDLMPSGHTLFFVILALQWHKHTSSIERFVFWVLSLSGCISLIVTRLHYTNDVLVALYVSLTVSYIYHLFATDPNYRSKSFILSWLEADLEEDKESKQQQQLLDRNVHIHPELTQIC